MNEEILVVYFHGCGSNWNTPKVHQLREAGYRVVSTNIPIDPEEADAHLTSFLSGVTRTAGPEIKKLVFVGTSLGGFWAARMGEKFDVIQILVNPSMTPEKSLGKYDIPKYIVDSYANYSSDGTLSNRHFFIAKNDPVVAPFDVPKYHPNVMEYDSDDHTGNSFFSDVISYIEHVK